MVAAIRECQISALRESLRHRNRSLHPRFASAGKAHASYWRWSVATRMKAIAARTPKVAKPSW
jgi:hypothetical protein